MTINEVFNWVTYVSNKYQSGAISPDEFNLACDVVRLELFNVKTGLPEQYKPGAPFPAQAYDVTQRMTDDLRNFIKWVPLTRGVNGYFALPPDYAAFSSMSFEYILNSNDVGGQPSSQLKFVEIVSDSEFRVRTSNGIIPPSLEFPCGVYRYLGIYVLPKQIKNVGFTYLRFPVKPVFGYTVVNDEYVYNPATSVQIDFPETLHPEFAIRVARYLGINIRDGELVQAVQERIITGE